MTPLVGEITVGIMGVLDVATAAPSGQRVYIEMDGKVRSFTPSAARRFAKKFRSSGFAELIELAAEIDALALEIETTAGKS